MTPGTSIALSPSEVRQYYTTRLPGLRSDKRKVRTRCSLHGGSADSLAIDLETGLWCCFSKCGRGGDILEFERELNHLGFNDALRGVSEVVGRPLGNAQLTPEEKKRWAAEKRRIEAALPAARLWRRAALEMGDEVLTLLKASVFDPASPHTANIGEIERWEQLLASWRRLDGPELVKTHREFSARNRKLAAAMVATARAHAEREQAAAATYLMELVDAA